MRVADRRRGRLCLAQLRKAKIQQLDARLGGQNVGGLQIAVGDALPVRGIERIANLRRILQRLIERQGPFQRCALDVLHHEVIWPDVIKRADVRMIERRNCLGLALEALGKLGTGCLDRDKPVKACVAALVYLSHATCPDRREDFVRAEGGTGSQIHGSLDDYSLGTLRLWGCTRITAHSEVGRRLRRPDNDSAGRNRSWLS